MECCPGGEIAASRQNAGLSRACVQRPQPQGLMGITVLNRMLWPSEDVVPVGEDPGNPRHLGGKSRHREGG